MWDGVKHEAGGENVPRMPCIADDHLLQALHFDYCPLHPLSRFQPAVQLALPGTLVLATSNGVECIHLAAEPVKWELMSPGAHKTGL
jgi:hypothetical protein